MEDIEEKIRLMYQTLDWWNDKVEELLIELKNSTDSAEKEIIEKKLVNLHAKGLFELRLLNKLIDEFEE